MKKLFLIIFCICLLYLGNTLVQAQTHDYSGDIYSTNNDSEFKLTPFFLNTKNYCLNEDFYTGLKLSDYKLYLSNVYQENNGISGSLSWKDENYIIKSGLQNVELSFSCYAGDITFSIDIIGVDDGWTKYEVKYLSSSIEKIEGFDANDLHAYLEFIDYNTSNKVKGSVIFYDYDNIKIGKNVLNWTFYPEDKTFKTETGVLTVDVIQDLSKISITTTSLVLEENTTHSIKINNMVDNVIYSWTSSDPKVAKVDKKNGLITALKKGKVTITCKITGNNGKTKTLKSKVVVNDKSKATISLTKTKLNLNVGKKFDININSLPQNSKVKWTTNNKKIAKVNSSTGVVTGVKNGSTNIICTITNGKEVAVLRCKVTIK